MDKRVKKKWVAALRSGEYARGTGALRKTYKKGPDRFCCLGVLCDIVSPGQWGPHRTHKEFLSFDGKEWQLPLDLRERLGISSIEQLHLIDMNDSGKNFNMIADWIEENL